jgi:hypothetical protein
LNHNDLIYQPEEEEIKMQERIITQRFPNVEEEKSIGHSSLEEPMNDDEANRNFSYKLVAVGILAILIHE